MEMLAKQFIGKECLVYTVTDTMGAVYRAPLKK